jgi:hypothetical protein
MISAGLAWLKDMATAQLNPPAKVIETARAQQDVQDTPQPATAAPTPAPAPAPMATTGSPTWARHTIPPQQSASLRPAEYGCVGLCIGGTCAVCDGLANEISKARHIKVPAIREIREGALLRRINALRGTR